MEINLILDRLLLKYVVFGLFLISLKIAIYDNFKYQSALLIKSTPFFVIVWSGQNIPSETITMRYSIMGDFLLH